jgi:hypothetical protein
MSRAFICSYHRGIRLRTSSLHKLGVQRPSSGPIVQHFATSNRLPVVDERRISEAHPFGDIPRGVQLSAGALIRVFAVSWPPLIDALLFGVRLENHSRSRPYELSRRQLSAVRLRMVREKNTSHRRMHDSSLRIHRMGRQVYDLGRRPSIKAVACVRSYPWIRVAM